MNRDERRIVQRTQELADLTLELAGSRGKATKAQRHRLAALQSEIEDIKRNERRDRFDPRQAQGFRDNADADRDVVTPVLAPEERVVEYMRDRDPGLFRSSLWDELMDPSRFSIGRMVRGMVSGEWHGAEMERRAMLEGTSSAGGALLPTPMSGTLIDRIRNAAQVMNAGASTVVMDNHTLYMGRLTSGPTPSLSWHSEGSQISSSDRTVDKITFTAKTLPNLTVVSMELLQDMTDEAAMLLENEIVQSLALEIDRVCLRGAGVDPEPCGIRNQSGVTITSLGANGATPIWDNIIDGVSTLRNANVQPNAILWASRTQQTFDKYKESTGAYLQPPPGIADVTRLVTNQIPTNLTQGSSNVASEIYIGAWRHLMLGVRENIGFEIAGGSGPGLGGGRVRVLQERYIDQGNAGLICFFRGDVQLAHAQSFNVLTGVTP